MVLEFAIGGCAAAYGAYRVGQDYVRRSMRSFAQAEHAWLRLESLAREMVEDDVPESVARLVVALIATTGCGCLVRGMLFSHYLPRVGFRMGHSEPNSVDQGFSDVESLNLDQRQKFWTIMQYAIVYDSFRNPLQGWFFRRALKSAVNSNQKTVDRYEAQLATVSVLSRRGLKVPA